MRALGIRSRVGEWSNHLSIAAIVAFSLGLVGAVANADVIRVDDLEFSRVQLIGSNELQITQGDSNTLKIRGDSDDLTSPPFVVQGDMLRLGITAQGDSVSDVKFKLSTRGVTQIMLQGSGDVFVKPLSAEDLLVSVDGSGQVRMFEVKAGKLELQVLGSGGVQAVRLGAGTVRLNVQGSGDIQVGSIEADSIKAQIAGSGDIVVQDEGAARILEIAMMGSGDIEMKDIATKVAKVTILGSGDAEVRVAESLEVEILGSGDLLYYGTPETSTSVMGSGEITQQDGR